MTRQCPLCQIPLAPRTSRGITVDVCPDCTGIWLDAGEYDAIITARVGGVHESDLGEARAPTKCRKCGKIQTGFACDDCKTRLAVPCPVDQTPMLIVMRDKMEFDRCPACKGIWIDGDERLALGQKSSQGVTDPGKLELARKPARKADKPAATGLEKRTCSMCGTLGQALRGVQRKEQWVCEGCVIDGALTTLDDRWRNAGPVAQPAPPGLGVPIALVVVGGLLTIVGLQFLLDASAIPSLGSVRVTGLNALAVALFFLLIGLGVLVSGARRFRRPPPPSQRSPGPER